MQLKAQFPAVSRVSPCTSSSTGKLKWRHYEVDVGREFSTIVRAIHFSCYTPLPDKKKELLLVV